MWKSTKQVGALAAVVLGVATLLYSAAAAHTPEQLIQNLVAAAQKGDVEGVLSGLTVSSRRAVTESFADQAELLKAQADFQSALDEHFGKSGNTLPPPPPDDLRTAIGRLASSEILNKRTRPDGSVELEVQNSLKLPGGKTVSRKQTLLARQEGGAWKLVLGYPPDGESSAQQITRAKQVTDAVRKGAYKDRLSAMVALSKAWAGKEGTAK